MTDENDLDSDSVAQHKLPWRSESKISEVYVLYGTNFWENMFNKPAIICQIHQTFTLSKLLRYTLHIYAHTYVSWSYNAFLELLWYHLGCTYVLYT